MFPWKIELGLDLGIAFPLAWALMQDITMRTTVRVVSWWDQGYTDLYQYGFPLPFTHWGISSSEIDVFFLFPMLLDFLVYFACTLLLVRMLPAAFRKWRWVLAVAAWVWMVLTLEGILWSSFHGDLKWVTSFEVISTQDPGFSWRKGGRGAPYGP